MHHHGLAVLVETLGMDSLGPEATTDECHVRSVVLFRCHCSEYRFYGPVWRTPTYRQEREVGMD
jgi:hypothetical protein